MASSWGHSIRFSIFGESHGAAIGTVIDGLPSGERIDLEELAAFMARRAPGQGAYATKRSEKDAPEFLSGLLDNTTTGAPLAAIIKNNDTRSGDYANLMDIPRPGHADYSANLRYKGFQDVRGGGHFSGRLTAPLCIAGGIAKQILKRKGILVGAHIQSIAHIKDTPFNIVNPTDGELIAPGNAPFPVLDEQAGNAMKQFIAETAATGDSVGGRIEIVAKGVPGGWGSPMFDGVENKIASIMLGIPAVRGIEFGYGMAAAECLGSRHNDPYFMVDDTVRTATNNHGGILGGITTGMPIVVKLAIKPTPSIAKEQDSISLQQRENAKLIVKGRHDPCIVPRAVPVTEAALALALLDLAIEYQGRANV